MNPGNIKKENVWKGAARADAVPDNGPRAAPAAFVLLRTVFGVGMCLLLLSLQSRTVSVKTLQNGIGLIAPFSAGLR